MSTPVLDVHSLAFAYPDGHPALFGVDLHVKRGERVALLGPNGAGKTTLVLAACGRARRPRRTRHRSVSGIPVTDATRREIRRRVGIVFQDPDDQLFMPTVEEDVAFGPANHGLRGEALRERVTEALAERSACDELRRPRPRTSLSAGERRRAAIAGPRARLPPRRPGPRRADLQPSTPPPAASCSTCSVDLRRRDPAGHPRPPVRARALPARRRPRPRPASSPTAATREVLADDGFMRAHRLELPAGFNPVAAAATL